MESFIRSLVFAATLIATSASFSAILITSSDSPPRLLGATNVDVNGTLYDVSFSEGSCFELFNGCSELSDFAFYNAVDAAAASQALLDQVLLNNLDTAPIQLFDHDPFLTTGCELGTGSFCLIVTPFQFLSGGDIALTAALNGVNTDTVHEDLFVEINEQISNNGTYAIWSRVTPIPVPSAFGLYVVALVTLQKIRRIKKLNTVRIPITISTKYGNDKSSL